MKSCRTTARPASLRRAGVLVSIFALLTGSAIPQETTLRSQSTVVLIPALVKDAQGETVYGLEAKDFIIEDDGVEQPVRLDEQREGQPVSIVVAIQTGRRAYYEFPRLRGLKAMLDPLFAADTARVAIVEFDSQVKLTRNFTQSEHQVDADLDNLQTGDGGATILDAIAFSVGLLKKEPDGRLRVLLLISETRDHGSIEKLDSVVSALGQSDSVMYALAFSPALSNILDTGRGTNKRDEMHHEIDYLDLAYRTAQAMRKNVPATISAMTGGEYELFATRKKFEVRMNDFTNHLHSRYLLSFAPKQPRPGLHEVRVQLRDPKDRVVLGRTSYWAESSQ